MKDKPTSVFDDFSVVRGGPFLRAMRSLRLAGPTSGLGPRAAAFLALLLWVPLLFLSAVQGAALHGNTLVPFLRDLAADVRFLVATPIFVIAEWIIDRRVREALIYMVRSGLVPEVGMTGLERIIGSARRWLDSALPELLALGFVVVWTALLRVELPDSISNWRFADGSDGFIRTPAGWFYILFSLPVSQFIFLRWVWRYIVWIWVLWRISRLNLRLIPTHPDHAAGLNILGITQAAFGMIAAGVSAIVAAQYAQEFLLGTTTVSQAMPVLFGYALGMVAILLGPLFVFTGKLVRAQWTGLLEYGVLADRYTLGFDRKWIRGDVPAEEALMGTADIQTLADLSNSYQIINDMRVVPADIRNVVLPVVAFIVVPLLPAALAVLPVDQIAREIIARLL